MDLEVLGQSVLEPTTTTRKLRLIRKEDIEVDVLRQFLLKPISAR